jgi:hypothetical protein
MQSCKEFKCSFCLNNIIRVSKLGERSKRVPQPLSIEDMEVWFIHFVGVKTLKPGTLICPTLATIFNDSTCMLPIQRLLLRQ